MDGLAPTATIRQGDLIMQKHELTVLARFRAKMGMEAEVLRAITSLIAPTKAEEGCVNYDLHRAQDNPALFFLYETWRSRQDLDDHLATPYLREFLEKAPALLAEPVDISFWDMLS
jgi:quinol monooxygenase YgiN